MYRFLTLLLVFSLLPFQFGCDSSSSSLPSSSNLAHVEDDNDDMEAAIKKATVTFGYFEANWEKASSAGVKIGMDTTDDSVEHIWFSPTKIEGNKITARCMNEPVNIPNLKIGDERTVDKSRVSDWMILEGRKCFGGYTIRVLSKLEPENAPPFEFQDIPE
ncbi:MAG: DUF2314 domain-containing protein [Planctomycetota bacterium]